MCELYPGEFEAMEHNGRMDVIEPMYYPQVDGITPTVVAESCDDCISIQAAISDIQEMAEWHTEDAFNAGRVIQHLKDLPPVNPQPKTIQEKQAESEKYQKAFDDGYENGYAQARFDYEQESKALIEKLEKYKVSPDYIYDYFAYNKAINDVVCIIKEYFEDKPTGK